MGRLYSVDSMQFVVGADQKLLQATITLNAYRFGGSPATPGNAGTSPATSGTTSASPAPTQ
jgi:hypothetical protein